MYVKLQVFHGGEFNFDVNSKKYYPWKSFDHYFDLQSHDRGGQSLYFCKFGDMYVILQVFYGGEFNLDVVSQKYYAWRSFDRYVDLQSYDRGCRSLYFCNYGDMYVKLQVSYGGKFNFDLVSKKYYAWRSFYVKNKHISNAFYDEAIF